MKTYDLLVEQRLLGIAVLNKNGIWTQIATEFAPHLFSDPQFKTIAQLVVDIAKSGQAPSVTRVYNSCRKHNLSVTTDDLIGLIDGHITPNEAKGLIEELKDLYKRRTIYQSLIHALNNLQEPYKSTEEIISDAQSSLIRAFEQVAHEEVACTKEIAGELFARQVDIQNGKKPPFYSLSLPKLNDLVGGLESGSLNIVAARPSMGKTAFALNEALKWAQAGLPGLVFSLEQTRTQLSHRLIANLQQIPLSAMREKLSDHYFAKFNSGLSELRELPIRISDKRGLTVERICSLARLEKMKNPDMKWIIVDYLGVLSFNPRIPHYLAVGDAVSKLRNLAEELDVFVLLLSQLNRGVETRDDKRPTMRDLRDSGNIEEYADVIIFLYREGYYNPGFLGKEIGNLITEIHLGKNRQGGNAGKRTLALFRQGFMQWEALAFDLERGYKAYIKEGN